MAVLAVYFSDCKAAWRQRPICKVCCKLLQSAQHVPLRCVHLHRARFCFGFDRRPGARRLNRELFARVLRMYMALDGNITVDELLLDPSRHGIAATIDVRRFIAFGLFTGVLRRVHRCEASTHSPPGRHVLVCSKLSLRVCILGFRASRTLREILQISEHWLGVSKLS